MSDVAAILLAAGRGTRFGEEPKLLARIGGKALVRHAAEAAVHSSADPVIVVTGHHAVEIEAALQQLPVQVVHNSLFADGLSTSLRAGFSALPLDTRAAVILLGDMPFVRASLIDALVVNWHSRGEPAALVPTLYGQRGNPVVISRDLHPMIEKLTGDSGAGLALRRRSDVLEWPTEDPAVIYDIDTGENIEMYLSHPINPAD
jgi:molybdenum cofactor cytidylyltransferase